jgi:glucose/arabinose dehydrogenase
VRDVAAGSTLGPLSPVTVDVPGGLNAAPFNVPRKLNLPAGWTATVYARISKARFMSLTPSGDLLVSQPSTGKVLLVRKSGGSATVSDWLTGLNNPHDIVFAEVKGQMYAYVSQSDKIVRYPYANGDQAAKPGETIVDGLPDKSLPELRGNYAHALKNIAVKGDTLYVSIGSTCNACASDTTSDPQRAAIYTYDASGHNANRKLFANGLRNAEGLAFVPGTDELWAVVNNRDNTPVPDDRDVDEDGRSDKGRRITGFVDDYPFEPFVNVKPGGFYGWPFCNPKNTTGTRNLTFDRDYELNKDGAKADCAKAGRIDVGLQPHSAPLGLTFTQKTKAPDIGAVVAQHGSWNSSVPHGYQVIYFPWTDKGPGDEGQLATGFVDLASKKAWARPVDAAVDTDGSILVSDDEGGSVIRLTPRAR